ncbi:MAG: hypothetical protein JWO02_758 [Solirubrobacterales bacterium]|nr:hypothetical protein [Solirubrobacterales bacterium]
MKRRGSVRVLVAVTLAVSLGLAAAVSPFASSSPDGLQSVAADKAFADRGTTQPVQVRAPAARYAFGGVHDKRLATGLSGFLGTLAVFAVTTALGALIRRRPWAHSATTHST